MTVKRGARFIAWSVFAASPFALVGGVNALFGGGFA